MLCLTTRTNIARVQQPRWKDAQKHWPRAYCRRVEHERSKKISGVSFRLPDDRKLCWVYYLLVLTLIALVLLGVSDDPDSDTKVQALTVLGLAAVSMLVCFYWAFSLRRASVSVVDYIKGTTASRTMLWFWGVFGSFSLIAPMAGIGGESFIPVWKSAIWTFAGVGSVLLTAGPAYKEYREAMGTVETTLQGFGQQQTISPVQGGVSLARHDFPPVPLLFAGLIAVAVLAARGGAKRSTKRPLPR